jgi:hypothetical protein
MSRSRREYNIKMYLTFMGPCNVNVFFQVYQQDATLYNILYYCLCSTCFRWFLRSSSGAQNYIHSIWYMSSLLAAVASGENRLKHVEH